MRNPLLNAPLWLNIPILIVSGIISFFCLLFGFAHVIEGTKQFIQGTNTHIPVNAQILGGIIVFSLCVIGIAMLIVVLASIKGILKNLDRSRS